MPNEISLNARLSITNGYLNDSHNVSRNFDQNAEPAKASGIASINHAAHEAIAMGDVATAGWAWFENLDDTNYVELGVVVSATFYPFAKLKAGEGFPLRLGTNTPYAKADTAAVKLKYEIYDD
jgi:hypothetical protein